jgi:hypothetical protein
VGCFKAGPTPTTQKTKNQKKIKNFTRGMFKYKTKYSIENKLFYIIKKIFF